ncbi:MAG: hypothetical protein ACXWNK_19380 [Vulcanimicrobiaceae bacterium]
MNLSYQTLTTILGDPHMEGRAFHRDAGGSWWQTSFEWTCGCSAAEIGIGRYFVEWCYTHAGRAVDLQ